MFDSKSASYNCSSHDVAVQICDAYQRQIIAIQIFRHTHTQVAINHNVFLWNKILQQRNS